MSLPAIALHGKVMKEWYNDNPPTQAKINALLEVIKSHRGRYEDLVEVLEKWYEIETIMRDQDFMYCRDMETKLRLIIDDSKKDKKFRRNLPQEHHTKIMSLGKESENPVEAKKQ